MGHVALGETMGSAIPQGYWGLEASCILRSLAPSEESNVYQGVFSIICPNLT